jgi:hypothetical protein
VPIRQCTAKKLLRIYCCFACELLQEHTFYIADIPNAQFLCHIITWKLTPSSQVDVIKKYCIAVYYFGAYKLMSAVSAILTGLSIDSN